MATSRIWPRRAHHAGANDYIGGPSPTSGGDLAKGEPVAGDDRADNFDVVEDRQQKGPTDDGARLCVETLDRCGVGRSRSGPTQIF